MGPCSGKAEEQSKVLARRLQMKRRRLGKKASGGSKIEVRGGQNGLREASGELLGGSWAPEGRQDRSGSAPRQLLGRSWRLLGRSWRLFGPSWPSQEVPGGSGEGLWEAILVLFLMVRRQKLEKAEKKLFFRFCSFLDRVWAWTFGFFLLAWHAPGGAANMEISCKSIVFYGTGGVGAFFAHLAESRNIRGPAYQK